ncbi:hypothetical protein HK096_001468, partial [Nowakowskiella sp. JEL0078]
MNAYYLRNEIAKFDESEQCESIQKSAKWLVRWNVYGQLAIVSSAILATHLGTPFAISVPAAVLASGLGVSWMGLRWRWMQDRFINAVSHANKSLKHRVVELYEKEFKRVVSDPLANVNHLISESINPQLSKAIASRSN